MLAVIRHGQTAWNQARRLQGRTDVPLDDHGRAQADEAGRILAREGWSRVVTSPLSRAVETASIINGHVGAADVEVDESLIERHYGKAEGLVVDEALQQWPNGDFPAAERWDDLAARSSAALRSLLDHGEPAIAVAHGTFIRAGVEALTGWECPRIQNCQIVLLRPEAAGTFTAQFVDGDVFDPVVRSLA